MGADGGQNGEIDRVPRCHIGSLFSPQNFVGDQFLALSGREPVQFLGFDANLLSDAKAISGLTSASFIFRTGLSLIYRNQR
jgi:hypothetical protein